MIDVTHSRARPAEDEANGVMRKAIRVDVGRKFVLVVIAAVAIGALGAGVAGAVPVSEPGLVSGSVTTVTGVEAAAEIIDGLRNVELTRERASLTIDLRGTPTTLGVRYADLASSEYDWLASAVVVWFLLSGLVRATRVAVALGRRGF